MAVNSESLRILTTPYSETMDSSCPLPEYPRPQFVRSSSGWTSLNGLWNYGIRVPGQPLGEPDGKILVPFSPECALSGICRQLLPDYALWYERQFTVSGLPGSGRLLLHFGAVDQVCRVWINGKKAGSHADGYLPFSFDITPFVHEGLNTVSAEVRDYSETGLAATGKQRLGRGGIWFTAQSGIWQTVWLERVPDTWLASVRVTPLFEDSSVRFSPVFGRGSGTVEITVRCGGTAVASGTAQAGRAVVLPLPGFRPWSPEDPFLYTFTARTGEDEAEGYFGMRSFGTGLDANGVPRLLLNGKPYYMNGLLDQGYWSDGLYTAPTDEAMVRDIETARSCGFNLLRKHGKIEPARWYYHCDRLGMLVWQDIPSGGGPCGKLVTGILPRLGVPLRDDHYGLFGRSSEKGRRLADKMRSAAVRTLYNAVCIAMWVPFNEGWGQFDALRAAGELKAQDPTRLVDHASGWYDQGGLDVASRHVFSKKIRIRPDRAGRPVILSYCGGCGLAIAGHVASNRLTPRRQVRNEADFLAAWRARAEEQILPALDLLSASVVAQLSDVEDEVDGLLTFDRRCLKADASALRQINSLLRFAGQAAGSPPGAGDLPPQTGPKETEIQEKPADPGGAGQPAVPDEDEGADETCSSDGFSGEFGEEDLRSPSGP